MPPVPDVPSTRIRLPQSGRSEGVVPNAEHAIVGAPIGGAPRAYRVDGAATPAGAPSARTSTLAAECRPSSRKGIDRRHHAAASAKPVRADGAPLSPPAQVGLPANPATTVCHPVEIAGTEAKTIIGKCPSAPCVPVVILIVNSRSIVTP